MALRMKLFVLVSLLLAACSSTPQRSPVSEPLETIPIPTFELQSLTLPDWTASDNYDVEVIGVGLGDRFGSRNGDLTETLTIPDPNNVTSLYVQVVLKHGDAYIAPDDVTVTSDSESKSFTGGGLSLSLPTDENGVALGNVAHMYEAIFAPSSSLTVDIENTGNTNLLTPRAFIVYVVRPAQGVGNPLSVGAIPNFYLYGQQGYVSATQTVNIPIGASARDVDVTFAISELVAVRDTAGTPDTRNVELLVEAGGVTNSGVFQFPNSGDELLLATLTLENVPAGTKDVTATVISQPVPPGGNIFDFGDSVYWNGLDVSVIFDPPEPALETVLAVEYDSVNDIFVTVGTSLEGDIDVYIGENNDWRELQENRDIDNRYTPEQFVDFALGDGDAMYGVVIGDISDYRIGFRQYAPRCTSINARVFSNKPWFGDGRPEAVGDLVSCLAIDYDVTNDIFVVVGKNVSGQIDVYTGEHNNWNKLQENRDIDNRYSPEQFTDFAIGDGEAMYGVAIGTIDDYKIGFRQFAPRCTSINARAFSNKPWFGDGKPEAIGDLVACLGVSYDYRNDIFVVVGENASGQIDVYIGEHNDWNKLQENRDIDNRYTPEEFVDFALGERVNPSDNYGVVVGNIDDYKIGFRKYAPRGTSINARSFSNKPWFGDGRPRAITE
ncbi:MAG: hypothetical protein AAF708_08135 [Deinococcota bacterium]